MMNDEIIITTCKDCGTVFEITAGEAEWLIARGLALPKRCKACRAKRKAQAQKEQQ